VKITGNIQDKIIVNAAKDIFNEEHEREIISELFQLYWVSFMNLLVSFHNHKHTSVCVCSQRVILKPNRKNAQKKNTNQLKSSWLSILLINNPFCLPVPLKTATIGTKPKLSLIPLSMYPLVSSITLLSYSSISYLASC